jgi:hypothetical protein
MPGGYPALADESAREMVSFLAVRLRDRPVLLIATLREDERYGADQSSSPAPGCTRISRGAGPTRRLRRGDPVGAWLAPTARYSEDFGCPPHTFNHLSASPPRPSPHAKRVKNQRPNHQIRADPTSFFGR